ncbi:unnamed protein product [Pleuronectes platessa]|uniref:Uncharacterized protein n=1 Tax=Pleuronectes platessa TaxID=8262 RepID=A0A9N7U599_PLEPL|nr:unnamed protein product [Pleuronectes platessa]
MPGNITPSQTTCFFAHAQIEAETSNLLAERRAHSLIVPRRRKRRNSPMWMIESESTDFHSWLQNTAASSITAEWRGETEPDGGDGGELRNTRVFSASGWRRNKCERGRVKTKITEDARNDSRRSGLRMRVLASASARTLAGEEEQHMSMDSTLLLCDTKENPHPPFKHIVDIVRLKYWDRILSSVKPFPVSIHHPSTRLSILYTQACFPLPGSSPQGSF